MRRSLLPISFLAFLFTGCSRGELVINTSALPQGTVGEVYQARITAAGGAEEGYVWRVTGGALPGGLQLATLGTPSAFVTGTPVESGIFDFTVQVTDLRGNEASNTIRLMIAGVIKPPEKLEIITAALPSGAIGVAYQATVTATGGSSAEYQWSIAAGELPPGIELEPTGTPSASISGVPTAAGTFTFTIAVRDSIENTAMLQLTLQIDPELPPLTITTLNLDAAQLSVFYAASIVAEGGTGVDYRWSIVAGALPAGLAIDATGTPDTTLEGTPTEDGSFDFTVRVEDSLGAASERSLRLVVAGDQLAIATGNLPQGVAGLAYSATIAAAGGSGAGYVWSVEPDSLPDGLTIAPAGTPETTLAGTPAATGTFGFDVTVTDDAGNVATAFFALEIAAAISIETESLPGGREGESYSAILTANGGAASGYQWSLVQGSLPSGLTLSAGGTPSTTISGTATEWGTFAFTVRVDEPLGSFAERELTIEVLPRPIEIITTSVAAGVALAPYAAVINTQNGSLSNYAWSVAGVLPPGLTLDPAGTPPFTSITGTPQLPGTYTATVTVTDGLTGDSDSARFTFSIAAPPLTITPVALPAPIYGTDYDTAVTATGGSGLGFSWSVVQGSLPRGLTLVGGTPSASIAGYPIAEGPYSFTLEVRDSFGTTAARIFTGAVARELVILTRALPIAEAGINYSAAITAAGGSGTGYTWSILTGSAPLGLVLGAAGSPATFLSGVTSAFGVHTFTVRVADSTGAFAVALLRLSVRAPQTSALIVGDLVTGDDTEVFLAGLASGSASPVRISPAGGGTRDASVSSAGVQFSPDNRRVAFIGDFTTDGRLSLYVADILPAIGAPVDVSGPITMGGNVTAFSWSPDSNHLLFRADKLTDNVTELFWVDMRGGFIVPAARISGALTAGGNVGVQFWSPDSEKVIYRADQNVDEQQELFLIDVSGVTALPPIRLNDTLVAGGDADDNVLFPADGNHVVYWAHQQSSAFHSLILAEITGGSLYSRTQLNVRGAIVDRAEISPDGARLSFVSDDDIVNARELYVVDLIAPDLHAEKVNPDFPDNARDVGSSRWSPDGSRILYSSDQDTDGTVELYIADADGLSFGAPERVNPAFTSPGANVDDDPNDGYGWSPDGAQVALRADVTTDTSFELWVTDVSVSPPVARPVTATLPAFASVIDFLFSPDSNRMVYRADVNADAQDELFFSDVSGIAPTASQQVNPTLPLGGDVLSGVGELRWSSSSQLVYYRADQVSDNLQEAYGVSFIANTPGTPFLLHGVLPANGDVNVFNAQP